MPQSSPTTEPPTVADDAPKHRGHTRRPPLAEVDSWELWQTWKQGERQEVYPWIGLLTSFCLMLAGMYSFFYLTTSLSNDTFGQFALTLAFIALFFVLWRRISPRRGFALAIVALMLAISGAAFLLWLIIYALTGWSIWAAIGGTLLLGFSGLLIGLPCLNAIARQQRLGD